MHHLAKTIRLSTLVSLLMIPAQAHALGAEIRSMFESLVFAFAPIWVTVGILVLVICGFTLVTATDEGKLEKARSTIIAVVIGGMVTTIIYLLGSGSFVGIMYNAVPGLQLINFGDPMSNPISLEATGIAGWLTLVSVMLGIVFIIIAALRAVSSLGDEGKYQSARNALIQAVIGFLVIGAAYVFYIVFYIDRTPDPLIALFSAKILIVLGFITLIAVAILIYAGLRMIISLGDESAFESAKSLAIRALIGLIIILLSFALVYIVMRAFSTTGP